MSKKSLVVGQQSALASRGTKKPERAITTHKTNTESTYAVPPTPFRLTLSDKVDLQDWADALQEGTRRKVTGAKVIRGLIAMKDKLPKKYHDMLLEQIKELA